MAEIGIIASVLQIADIGLRLSLRLYTFGETVASADKSIISISKDVSLTSNVLKELGQTLDRDRTSRICTADAVQLADIIVKECLSIFQDMDQVLVKNFANTRSAGRDRKIKAAQTLERLRWPFIKGKIKLLTSNLERQKTSLVLMLNIIVLAKQQFESTEPPTIITEQRSLIRDLVRSNEGYIHRFDQLRLGYRDVSNAPEVFSMDCNNLMPTLEASPHRRFAGPSALSAGSQEDPNIDARGLGLDIDKSVSDLSTSDVLSSDHRTRLLQQYNVLMSTLSAEVSAPKYEIAEESRSRIKVDIAITHKREMRLLEQAQYPGLPCYEKKMQPPFVAGTGATQVSASEVNEDQIGTPVQHRSIPPPSDYSVRLRRVLTDSPTALANQYGYGDFEYMGTHLEKTISPSLMESTFTSHSTLGENETLNSTQLWPPENDELLIRAHQQGLDWQTINSQYFPDKAADACRDRYERLMEKRKCADNWDGVKTDKLPEAHENVCFNERQHPPAKEGEKWQTVEAERMKQGLDFGMSVQQTPYLTISEPQAPALESVSSPPSRIPKATIRELSQWVDDCPNHRPSKRTQIPSRSEYLQDPAVFTQDTPVSKYGASDKMHPAGSREASGVTIASEDSASFPEEERSRVPPREKGLESRSESDIIEDWTENVVDDLLTTWTTFPVHLDPALRAY